MEEKRFVNVRKEEFSVKEFIKRTFGKGKISGVKIEYTPVGEKIIIATHKPGLVIGKRGEKIAELTEILKRKYKLENPHVDISEIKTAEFDAQLVADDIALTLERFGALKYKATAYKMLERIKAAGALGAEIRTSGKLPSERARTWRFAFGYLKKTGDAADIVDRAESVAETKQGVIGIKVAILAPGKKIHDRVEVSKEIIDTIKKNISFSEEEVKKPTKKGKKQKIRIKNGSK